MLNISLTTFFLSGRSSCNWKTKFKYMSGSIFFSVTPLNKVLVLRYFCPSLGPPGLGVPPTTAPRSAPGFRRSDPRRAWSRRFGDRRLNFSVPLPRRGPARRAAGTRRWKTGARGRAGWPRRSGSPRRGPGCPTGWPPGWPRRHRYSRRFY